MRDLAALPPDAWERRQIGPLVVELLREIDERSKRVSERLSKEEKEIQMTADELYESIKDEGRKEGQNEAQLRTLAHQFERKLGRKLKKDEQARLRQRIEALGANRVSDVVIDLDGTQLARWLKDAAAR